MNPSNKLADLRALASSAVAEESSKATSLLRKSPPSEAAQETGAGGGTKASKQSRKNDSAAHVSPITRVPTVLRGIDMKAISTAKIYLMQAGRTGVSTNNVIQVALRSMKVGPELSKLLDEILAEDKRRKQ